MAAGGARAVFDEFAALPAEPPDVAPWLARLAASTGASDPFGEQGVEGARVFALALDAADPLSAMRHQFHIPKARDDAATDSVYLTGHSLGLQPVSTAAAVQAELDKWAARGVAGHFEGDLPWASCEEKLVDLLGELVGARNPQLEVAGMNSLTVNLHFLMAAFYRPVAGRAGILIEAGAFPSDRYAVASQIAHHGFDPAEWMVEVQPDQGTGLLTTEAITEAIARHEGRLALVLLGGVNYLTGQVHEMQLIASFVAELNATRRSPSGNPPLLLGYDLAHAAGNVPLQLHDWGVDFAAWCTYKYLNAGAGCLGAIFVHERHATDSDTYPRLAGWWGVPHAPGPRFEMRHAFEPSPGAPGFGVSNVNPLMVACLRASLRTLAAAGGVRAARSKSMLLTGFLERRLHASGLTTPREATGSLPSRCGVAIITPANATRRGCQLSLRVLPPPGGFGGPGAVGAMRHLESQLEKRGVVTDAREPDIVRAAPVPLYNSFEDVALFVERLGEALVELAARGV